MKVLATNNCELCDGEAAVFCPSDFASLCWSCDAKVHDANFLVARHVRNAICSKCNAFTGICLSGSGVSFTRPPSSITTNICPSCCSPPYSSSSSAPNISRSRRRSRVPSHLDAKAMGIFVNWHRRLGLPAPSESLLIKARDGLRIFWGYSTLDVIPLRVCLAASLWFGFRFSGDGSLSTCQALKRLEEISGVPAKLISAAQSKLESVFFKLSTKTQSQTTASSSTLQLEEGWADSECSRVDR